MHERETRAVVTPNPFHRTSITILLLLSLGLIAQLLYGKRLSQSIKRNDSVPGQVKFSSGFGPSSRQLRKILLDLE